MTTSMVCSNCGHEGPVNKSKPCKACGGTTPIHPTTYAEGKKADGGPVRNVVSSEGGTPDDPGLTKGARMNTWDYHVEAGPTDWAAIQQMLTQAGSEGWELVSFGLADDVKSGVFENTTLLGGMFFAVLKRPRP